MSQARPPQQYLPHTFRCRNHPERDGVGICVSCRAVICVECSTRVDRMNYCIRCLQAAAPPEEPAEDRLASGSERTLLLPLLLVVAFGVSVGVFFLMGVVLATARSAMPGGVGGG